PGAPVGPYVACPCLAEPFPNALRIVESVYRTRRGQYLGKIAVDLRQALAERRESGAAGQTAARVRAGGGAWQIHGVMCTAGPQDRLFEERHDEFRIAVVVAGSFQYRSRRGSALMTPGSLLLGGAGHSFECAHNHDSGDRCLAFGYAPQYFERLAAD